MKLTIKKIMILTITLGSLSYSLEAGFGSGFGGGLLGGMVGGSLVGAASKRSSNNDDSDAAYYRRKARDAESKNDELEARLSKLESQNNTQTNTDNAS